MIKEFFKKYGKEKKIKKGDYLYKKEENDKNIYFIENGKVLLTVNNQDIAIVGSGDISGEKSFLENKGKPIDAIAISDVKAFFITPESFNNFPETEKTNFLKQVTLFISDRVYLLNDIISNISYINNYITTQKAELNIEYIKKFFENLVKIENAYIYKLINQAILPIFENILKCNYDKLHKDYKNDIEIQVIDNEIKINIPPYIIILEYSKLLKPRYVVENTIIHSISNVKQLAENLENLKNQQLNNFLE